MTGCCPFFEEQKVPLLRVLTDRGTEYCGQREHHEYQLYLAAENIDHSRTKARHPQTNGICERFQRTIQEEFYATAFRKKLYHHLDELQANLDDWLLEYNLTRTHSASTVTAKLRLRPFWNRPTLAQEDAGLFFQHSAGAGAESCTAKRRRRRGRSRGCLI